jgi:hypothetical protein
VAQSCPLTTLDTLPYGRVSAFGRLYDRASFSLNIVIGISYSILTEVLAMKLIKFVMAVLGLIFGVMLFFWLFGLVTSLLWYGLVIGILGAIGYGGYKLFKRAEQKLVGGGSAGSLMDDRDFSLSWEDYDRKYLKK